MTASQQIDASLARAEVALVSRDRTELLLAQASLEGCYDWAAKQVDTGDRAWLAAALKAVKEAL